MCRAAVSPCMGRRWYEIEKKARAAHGERRCCARFMGILPPLTRHCAMIPANHALLALSSRAVPTPAQHLAAVGASDRVACVAGPPCTAPRGSGAPAATRSPAAAGHSGQAAARRGRVRAAPGPSRAWPAMRSKPPDFCCARARRAQSRPEPVLSSRRMVSNAREAASSPPATSNART